MQGKGQLNEVSSGQGGYREGGYPWCEARCIQSLEQDWLQGLSGMKRGERRGVYGVAVGRHVVFRVKFGSNSGQARTKAWTRFSSGFEQESSQRKGRDMVGNS